MCKVSVTCHCNRGGDGLLWIVGLIVAAAMVVPVVVALINAVVSLVNAIVMATVIAVGVVVAGWVLKAGVEKAVEEISLHRHNERMARQFPHLRAELQRVNRRRAAIAPPAHVVTPVQIYPTPRKELR